MASVQISKRFKEIKIAAKKSWTFYGFRMLGNTFLHILYDLGYILTSQKPLLFVIDRLECGQLQLLTGVKGRKFETSSTKDTRDIHGEKRSAFTRLKFQQDNLVIKGLSATAEVMIQK